MVALVILHGTLAHGHKLNVFATAEGKTISGYAYSSSGRPRNAVIRVLGPEGRKLGEVTTNENGEFTFEVEYRCDHVLVIDTGDGHGATWTVEAGEFSTELPPLEPGTTEGETDAAAQEEASAGASDIERAVARAVEKEIAPLRAQINRCRAELEQYQAKIRLHDVIGGIGYIFGIAGIAFYFLGVRRRQEGRHSGGSPPGTAHENI